MSTETWHNKEDAGTESNLNLTININGSDILDQGIEFQEPLNSYGHTEKGNAGFTLPMRIEPFDTDLLTDYSIRLGIRGDDAWAPRNGTSSHKCLVTSFEPVIYLRYSNSISSFRYLSIFFGIEGL
jgi:hypothetical protein